MVYPSGKEQGQLRKLIPQCASLHRFAHCSFHECPHVGFRFSHVRHFTCFRRLTNGRERRQHGLHRLRTARTRGGEMASTPQLVNAGGTMRPLLGRPLGTPGLLHRHKKECATLLYLHHFSQTGTSQSDETSWLEDVGWNEMVFGHVLQCQSKKVRELLTVEVTFSEGRICEKEHGWESSEHRDVETGSVHE